MHPITVLILEDQPFQLLELSEVLEKWGYKVLGALTVDRARFLLRHETIDLALLDVKLENEKNASGIDIAKLINEDIKIPFLFITAAKQHYQKGAFTNPSAYIIKPYDEANLLGTIYRGISYHYSQFQIHRDAFLKEESLIFNYKNCFHRINLTDICYFKAINKELSIYYQNALEEMKTIVLYGMPMNTFEELLSGKFKASSPGYFVSLSYP